MRFGGRPEVAVLIWFVAPGLIGGLLAWVLGGAFLEVLRSRRPQIYTALRTALPLLILVGAAVSGAELGKHFAPRHVLANDQYGFNYQLVLFAPLISLAVGSGTGLLVALYELSPTAKSPDGEPLSIRPAKAVLLHFGSFLLAIVAVGYLGYAMGRHN